MTLIDSIDSKIYKIKDSVDLFLTDEKYLTAFFMNSRRRKNFLINNEMICLLEKIDGKRKVAQLKELMEKSYGTTGESVEKVIGLLLKNKIISEVINSDILEIADLDRFSRQINYFAEFFDDYEKALRAQKKLFDAKVLVFGCGAIGGNIAIELAMAGVRNITIFDFDTVDESDLSRHLYFSKEKLGKNKTQALKEFLESIDKQISVEIINSSLKPADDIENLIQGKDFVVNTLDEPYIGYTSSKISRVCMKYRIPHFIAGGFDAHLSSTGELIIPYVTPCVECYAGYFKESLKNWKPAKHPVAKRMYEIGGTSMQSLFSASYAAIEIVKYITGIVDLKKNFKIRGEFLFKDMELTYLSIKRNPDCPICGRRSV